MLIRLVSHPEDNSDHIDKMIYIEGLPESMIYREADGKRYLKEPWRPDNEENIPDDIKEVFFKNPLEIWFQLPKEQGQTISEYSQEVNAFLIDYQSGKGEQLWLQIEKILDRETPRDQSVPKPAVVGNRKEWTLVASDVPAVVLSEKEEKPISVIENGNPVHVPNPNTCEICNKPTESPIALKIHKGRMHKKAKVS